MQRGRRQPTNAPASRSRRWGGWLKRWTVPIIGGVTPVGLIVVNIAAFIVKHLSEVRWTIAVLAFVSGLMLNSWTALNLYRVGRRRFPEHALLHDRNQELVMMGAMAVVIIASFLTAFFCYQGLSSEENLPNAMTFLTGAIAIAIPILLTVLFGRANTRGRTAGTEPPPQRPAASPAPGPGAPAGPAPSPGGYTPPRYLPPQ